MIFSLESASRDGPKDREWRPERQEGTLADDARPAAGVIRLWPASISGEGPSESRLSIPVADGVALDVVRNVSEPTLTVFRPPGRANGVGVIVAPGGAWRMLSLANEGSDVATWLAERGYTAAVLKYRLLPTAGDDAQFIAGMAPVFAMLARPLPAAQAPRNNAELMGAPDAQRGREQAGEDARRALELFRERAPAWGVDPVRIGMIGFSAGAIVTVDLALTGGLLAFAAPIYGGSTDGRPVPADAPPLFACVASDDRRLFKMVEGLYADWSNADRPAELHIFARGGHGFGVARQGAPVDRWIDLLGDWLSDQGFA
jgi:dienelactone hydrolase